VIDAEAGAWRKPAVYRNGARRSRPAVW